MSVNTGVRFEPIKHEYFNNVGIKYTSATGLKKLVFEDFDEYAEYWATYKVLQDLKGFQDKRFFIRQVFSAWTRTAGIKKSKDSTLIDTVTRKLFNLTKEQLEQRKIKKLGTWGKIKDIAAESGSGYHDWREGLGYKNGHDNVGLKLGKTRYTYSFDLSKLAGGVYLELMLYNHKYRVSGQADKTLIEDEIVNGKLIRWVDIDDYKTSKKIEKESRFKMLPPLSHLPATDYYGFALQLSIYAYMLECFGYTIRTLTFTHCKIKRDKDRRAILDEKGRYIEEELIPYVVPYLKGEVIALMKYNLKQKTKNK